MKGSGSKAPVIDLPPFHVPVQTVVSSPMKIYTKKGDTGETGLLGGSRVFKDDPRLQTYGTLDELNCVLGMVLTDLDLDEFAKEKLERIQNELFVLGAELATPATGASGASSMRKIEEKNILQLEKEIDEMEKILPPLKQFILPGGSRPGAELHLARTVCRRAERWVAHLNRLSPLRREVLQYLNRLSDYLFVFARSLNHQRGIPEMYWKSDL